MLGISGQNTVNFLLRGKIILPLNRGSGKSGSDCNRLVVHILLSGAADPICPHFQIGVWLQTGILEVAGNQHLVFEEVKKYIFVIFAPCNSQLPSFILGV